MHSPCLWASTPAFQTIVAGGQQIILANVQLDGSASGEDVRINSLPIRLTTTGSPALNTVTGCQLYNTSNTALNYGTDVVNSPATTTANTFIFENSLTVPKGTTVTLSLECTISSSVSPGVTYTFSTLNTDTMSVAGVTSGSSVNANIITGNAGTMTVASGSLTMHVDASSPTYSLVSGNTTGVIVGVYRLRPTAENMSLTKIGIQLGNVASVADISRLYFYNAAGQLLGTTPFTQGSVYATSTLSTTLSLLANTDTLVTVKADLNSVNTGNGAIEGDLIQVNPSSVEATGLSSGLTNKTSSTDLVAGIRHYQTFPTIAQDTLSSTGMADGRLLHFKVTADSKGNVGIGQFTFKIATTTANLTNVQLFGFTDAGYSTGISAGASNGGQIGNTLSTGVNNNVNFTITPNTSPVEVPAGQTYYFELRAAVSGVTTSSSVLSTLVGDTNTTPVTGVAAFSGVTGNLIWSPNATSTAATSTSSDWTNGFSISGLPNSGIFQSRSQ